MGNITRIQTVSVAHTRALEEEAAREVIRQYGRDNPDLMKGFMEAVLTDVSYGVAFSRAAVILKERRAMMRKKELDSTVEQS